MTDQTPAAEAARIGHRLARGRPTLGSRTFLKRLGDESDRARVEGRPELAKALDDIAGENGL